MDQYCLCEVEAQLARTEESREWEVIVCLTMWQPVCPKKQGLSFLVPVYLCFSGWSLALGDRRQDKEIGKVEGGFRKRVQLE
jgi:hypothetical protein